MSSSPPSHPSSHSIVSEPGSQFVGLVYAMVARSFPPSDEADSELLFRESNIPPWRFAFLCVGFVEPSCTVARSLKVADVPDSLCLGLFISMLDASIVATSLFTIGVEFNDLERINWVALAYTLAFLGCAVFFARSADVVGRRNAFIAAFVIFFSFSLGCGFSQNLDTLIACRTLQGIGGSGLFSVTMIIFPEMSPPSARKVIAPIIGMVISMSGVLGPILGGLLTHYATWRWVFWIK